MIKTLYLIHHTHTDIGYTHPQPVVWELHNRYLDEAIALCEQTADWPEPCRMKWTCEVTSTLLHWLDKASDAKVRRLQALVRNGQISFGAMWCHWTALAQEDLLLESLAPVRMLRERFGAPVSVAIQHDVNGTPWPVADMLLDAGIPNLLFGINIHMGGFPLTRPLIFRWAAPSGRTITAFSGEHYNTFSREVLRAPNPKLGEINLRAYLNRIQENGWPWDFAYLTATHPYLEDNNPPNPDLSGFIRRWNEEGRQPFIHLLTAEQLFERVAKLDNLPVHSGDWTDYWTSGCASSALDVAMARRAHGAWWTARMLGATDVQEATRNLFLAYEHTWNVFSSTAAFGPSHRFEPVPEAEQRIHKSAYCSGALSLSRMLRRDALDVLAQNPPQAGKCEGLLVFNPTDSPRRVCLRIPNDILDGQHPLLSGTKHRIDVLEDLHSDVSCAWIGPLELPAFGVQSYGLADLPRAMPTGVQAGADFIASEAWRLQFDPATGAIRSLQHRGRECFDAGLGWDLFGAVQETVAQRSRQSIEAGDPRYDLFLVSEKQFDIVHSDISAWNYNWPAKHTRAEKLVRCATRVDAEGAHLTRVYTMPGVQGELQQTISLLAHEPRVRFEAYFNKADVMDPEALYFTFPFQMPGAAMHFDTAGQAVAFHTEQLPGACRDWVTAGSWVAAAGATGCLTLACPDAPLFQVGGFHYGRGVIGTEELNQAFLLAWPMNNYWNTNFRASQPGYVRFRYELAWSDTFDPATCARFGAAAARPPVYHPLATACAEARQLLDAPGNSVTVSLVKHDDTGMVVGLHNHADKPQRVRFDSVEVELPSRRLSLVRIKR